MFRFAVRAGVVVSLIAVVPGCFLAGPVPSAGEVSWGPNLICPAEPAQLTWDLVNDENCGTCDPEILLTPAPTPPAAQEFSGSVIWNQTETVTEYSFDANACVQGTCQTVERQHSVEVLDMLRDVREVVLPGRCGPSWTSADLETEWSRDCVRMGEICNDSEFVVTLQAEREGVASDPVFLEVGACTSELGEEPANLIGTAPSLVVDPDFECAPHDAGSTMEQPTVGGEETPDIELSIVATCSTRCVGP